uniref:Prolyl 4-hydroxylase alpha subunit Fe(2+) 2OG dioxygenase domain-containing protein n=1 Tax=viral metagenome TaxID=1070528 RepID=A0A6C0HCB3_9ZZZZ
MDKIIVCEKFLKDDEITRAKDIVFNKSWRFGHQSTHEKLYANPFWSMDLDDEDYYSKYLLNIIEKHFSKKFKLLRVYANGHTFGQDGAYHIDSDLPNAYTFVLYLSEINPEYVETAGGNLYFKLPNEKFNICYEPIFNRGIFFPSNYVHKGCAFNRYVMNLRISVAWKLLEIIE